MRRSGEFYDKASGSISDIQEDPYEKLLSVILPQERRAGEEAL